MEEQTQIKELSLPLYQVKGWMKLLGVVMIVYGAIAALSIVGIIIAWLPIWLGILLFQAATAAESAQITGNKAQFMSSLQKLKMYFIINGVVMIVALIATGLGLLMAGGSILALMGNY